MPRKYITSYYDDIVNVCDIEIDCKQGLYLALLNCLGENVQYIGSRWPWLYYYKPRIDSFDIEANKIIDIVNMLTKNSIKNLYNIELRYFFFNSAEDVRECIRNNIENNIPVIVNTDQYYIPYHHEYIYMQKHGLHATLIMGFDDYNERYSCFSVTPGYKGTISYSDLHHSIENSSVLWCGTLTKSNDSHDDINETMIFKCFKDNIREVYSKYNKKDTHHLEPNDFIYTKDILSVFDQCINVEDDDETYKNLRILYDGRWGWEINVNVNLFEKYLMSDYVKNQYKNISAIIESIEEYKLKWNLTYRKIYKMLRRKPNDMKQEIKRMYSDFYTLVEFEKNILDKLIL